MLTFDDLKEGDLIRFKHNFSDGSYNEDDPRIFQGVLITLENDFCKVLITYDSLGRIEPQTLTRYSKNWLEIAIKSYCLEIISDDNERDENGV